MKLSRDRLLELLTLIEHTREHELDCDAFLERLPAYLDQADAAPASPELNAAHAELLHHLRLCPECLEEFEALLRARAGGADDA